MQPRPKHPRRRKILRIGCLSGIGLLVFCVAMTIYGMHLPQTPTTSATAITQVVTSVPTHMPTSAPTHPVVATSIPTSKPTTVPTHQATPTTVAPTSAPTQQPTQPPPAPKPTPKPSPTPTCQAVNGNPWCYNFNPGNLIYNPPPNFCDYFNCIASFWNGSGFVNECSDGTYSLSGGHSGDCSHHGGEWRPLYSH